MQLALLDSDYSPFDFLKTARPLSGPFTLLERGFKGFQHCDFRMKWPKCGGQRPRAVAERPEPVISNSPSSYVVSRLINSQGLDVLVLQKVGLSLTGTKRPCSSQLI